MKKSSVLLILFSAVFSVWGMADIYKYFTIGKKALFYYDGADVVRQLVQYNLTQGIVKIAIGMCIILILVIRTRTHK